MQTHLVISFTPDYLAPAAVTLKSVLEASGEGTFLVHCLVSGEIPEEGKRLLEEMCGGRMAFEYRNLGGCMEGCYVDPRYTEAASYRLMLPELLPELDTVIYIDCDMIVRQDLAALEMDIGDNYLAAVYEAPIEDQAARHRELGIDPGKYFNSGFLVMNLDRMRKERVSENLTGTLKGGEYEFPDQDVLNIVCRGRVKALPVVYNSIRTFFLPQYGRELDAQYGAGARAEIESCGNIHYTGGKPWNIFTVRFADWWRVYDTLPEGIRSKWNPRAERLWKIYRTRAGMVVLDAARTVYRKIMH